MRDRPQTLPLSRPEPLEIRLGNVPLTAKLDAIGATLRAVAEAHGDTCTQKCWAAMNRAMENIAEATINSKAEPQPAILQHPELPKQIGP